MATLPLPHVLTRGPHHAFRVEHVQGMLVLHPNAQYSPRNVPPSTTEPPKTPCPTSQPTRHRPGPQHQTTPCDQPPCCQTHSLCAPAPTCGSLVKTMGSLGHIHVHEPPALAGMYMILTRPPSEVSHEGDAHAKPTMDGPSKSISQPSQVTGAPRTSWVHQLNAITYPLQPILNEFTHSYIPAEAQKLAAECSQI